MTFLVIPVVYGADGWRPKISNKQWLNALDLRVLEKTKSLEELKALRGGEDSTCDGWRKLTATQ